MLSPDDRPPDVRRKISEYLENGVAIAVVVDPDAASVTTFRPAQSPAALRAANALLDLSDVIPGFRCSLGEIFE